MKKGLYILFILFSLFLAGCSNISKQKAQVVPKKIDTSSRALTDKECVATGWTAIIYTVASDIHEKKCESPQKQIRRIKWNTEGWICCK